MISSLHSLLYQKMYYINAVIIYVKGTVSIISIKRWNLQWFPLKIKIPVNNIKTDNF